MKSNCPDNSCWQMFIDEEMRPDEKNALEAHLSSCPSCTQTVSELRTENRWLIQLFGNENEALSLSEAVINRIGFGDIGIKWSGVVFTFFMLGLMVLLISTYLLESNPIFYWLSNVSSLLLSTAALADCWQLLITVGVNILSIFDWLTRFSLVVALISAGFGLMGMRALSRSIVWHEEVMG